MALDRPRIDDIYLAAIEVTDDGERAGYLDEVCGDDTQLRARVDRLLSAQPEVTSFLEGPAPGINVAYTITHRVTEKPGDTIGPYKLLQQIGEGGMGVVYMAEQTKPIERRVALKIIKPGMDTRQVIARFEAERQALAMMDHPNIAKVLDAGTTDTGRPYFVMELVKGVPITEYCDQHHLTPRERLELFLPVCQAVQHAHQKGIIHRDIKPSNVLVAHYDDQPVPKIIDFGVAKAVEHRLTEKTMFTEFGQVLGTIEYMSPEQARMNQWDVDTRSDIYSLGVVLYELLSGETPFDRQRLRSAAFDELLQIIREEEPPRPSIRLSSSESLASIAANRQIEPKQLTALVRGELDWIVMKSLEKDRTRRYETANKFAEDVQHYLHGDAVEACPPSSAYRFRKFVGRNKAVIVTSSAVAAALIIGTGVATWQAIRASQQRDRAVIAELTAQEEARRADFEAKKALAEAARAERELARANEVKSLIKQMLEGVGPDVALGADIRLLKGILDETAERFNNGEINDEHVAAELNWTIGGVYLQLALYPEAERHLQAALAFFRKEYGEDWHQTLKLMNNLGLLYMYWGKFDKAESLWSQAIEINERKWGERDPHTLRFKLNLATVYVPQGRYEDAEQLLLKTLPAMEEVLGEKDQATLLCMNSLGSLYVKRRQFRKAEESFRRMLELSTGVLPEGHLHRLAAKLNLANVLAELGRQNQDLSYQEEAEGLQEQVLDQHLHILGPTHPKTLASQLSLAQSYGTRAIDSNDSELSDAAKAMLIDLVTVGEAEGKLQPDHEIMISAKEVLSSLYAEDGDYEGAENTSLAIIELLQKKFPMNDPNTLRQMYHLGNVYRMKKDYASAIEWLTKAEKGMREVQGIENEITLATINDLGYVYLVSGEYEAARTKFEECLPIMRRELPRLHPYTVEAVRDLARAYEQLGLPELARDRYRELLDLQIARAEKMADSQCLNHAAWSLLTHPYKELRNPARALTLAQRACEIAQESADDELGTYLDTLALAQRETGDSATAIETLREALNRLPDNVSHKTRKEIEERLAQYETETVGDSDAGTEQDGKADSEAAMAVPLTDD